MQKLKISEENKIFNLKVRNVDSMPKNPKFTQILGLLSGYNIPTTGKGTSLFDKNSSFNAV